MNTKRKAPEFDETELAVAVAKFLEGPERNRWLYGTNVSLYLRKSKRHISSAFPNSSLVTCLDIASIEVRENQRGRGLGTAVLNYLHRINPYRVTVVECIQTNRFYSGLARRDWITLKVGDPSPSVFKLTHSVNM